jgi:hypothetical protein
VSETPSIKGSVIQSRLAFVQRRGGDVALAQVLARMPPRAREVVSGIVLPSGWYPFDAGSSLDEAIAAHFGGGTDIFREMGAESARDNLSASHKVYVRERDPHGLLKSAASIYRLYYDSGHRTYERVDDHSVILRTFDSRTFSRADCLTVVGWHEKAIAMCGGKKPRVRERKCRARGDDVCEYFCEWE